MRAILCETGRTIRRNRHNEFILEPESPIISFPFKPGQLIAIAKYEEIVLTYANSDNSCSKALSRAQSFIRFEIASSSRPSTLDCFSTKWRGYYLIG